jgi:hypothetical protein
MLKTIQTGEQHYTLTALQIIKLPQLYSNLFVSRRYLLKILNHSKHSDVLRVFLLPFQTMLVLCLFKTGSKFLLISAKSM